MPATTSTSAYERPSRRQLGQPHRAVQEEFERAAEGFAQRTAGRFDAMDVVGFSRVQQGASVLEVGAGTGNFLTLFREVAGSLIAVDVTFGMLATARRNHAGLSPVVADGARLPLESKCMDLSTSAQMLHHVREPVPVLREMRRVTADGGLVLVVDQVAQESYESATAMTDLELVRDPTHAASRPPSAFKVMLQAAGLAVVEQRIFEDTERFSQWMWPDEFPAERIAAVKRFIDERGDQTGMGFEPDGDDYVFVRRRIMLLAGRA